MVVLVTVSVVFLYFNPLIYILDKYGESSLLIGFMNTRGDVWLRSFDYALSNLFTSRICVDGFPEDTIF